MATLITLPPTFTPSRTLDELRRAADVWTRQAEQSIRQVAKLSDSSASTISQIADSTHTGLLSSVDWTRFNSKQPAGNYVTEAPTDSQIYGRQNSTWVPVSITGQALTEVTSAVLTITGGSAALLAATSIQVTQAGTSQAGYLSSTDWNTFNGKQNAITGAALTEVTSAVLTITGGAAALLAATSIQVKQASTSQAGYLSSTDWNTFNGKQAAGSYLTDAPSDGTTYGRLNGAWAAAGGGGGGGTDILQVQIYS